MGKVALVFPGQGAQYVGMAKDLYENNAVAKSVIDEASDALNMDLKTLCLMEMKKNFLKLKTLNLLWLHIV